MQESNKVESAVQVQNEVKQDEFRVGDVVWCLLYGKGVIKSVDDQDNSEFPILVAFESGEEFTYKPTGEFNYKSKRILFFSEPKIEASVTRPFVPTLVGKRVAVRQKGCHTVMLNITFETPDIFGDDEGGFDKSLVEVYEVSSENLLTSKK